MAERAWPEESLGLDGHRRGAMPFSIVCVAPGASEVQVIELANSIGKGWWALTCHYTDPVS